MRVACSDIHQTDHTSLHNKPSFPLIKGIIFRNLNSNFKKAVAIVHFQYNVYTSAWALKSQRNLTRGIIGKLAVKKIVTEMEKNTHQLTKCPIIDFWGLSIMLQESFCLIPFPCNPEMTAWANSLMNSQWIHTRQKRQLEVPLTTRSPQHCVGPFWMYATILLQAHYRQDIPLHLVSIR